MNDARGPNLGFFKIFQGLDRQTIDRLSSAIIEKDLDEGQILFRQGDAADALYLVESGRLQAALEKPGCPPIVVGAIGPGALVGEIAILMGGRRNATVTAAEKTRLIRLPADEVHRLLSGYPALKRSILDTVRQRLRRNEWLKILSAYFGEIDKAKYELIESRFTWVHLNPGQALFHDGDPADGLYFLIHGFLRVIDHDENGEAKAIGAVYRGEIVGEMAVLSGERRMASVVAVRDSDLVRLSEADFEEVNKSYPAISLTILRILVDRLRARGRASRRRRGAVNLALVPAGPDVPLAEFARRLQESLSAADRVVRLDAGALATEFAAAEDLIRAADDDPLHLGLTAWLEELETRHDFVLYQADAALTPWTLRCLKQADQILLVARAGDDPAVGPLEQESLPGDAGLAAPARTLVLIHPGGEKLPTGTAAWLQGRRLADHLHVRWDRSADVARLARILSGRSVGLVLGGGGARGMAHLGVLRALEERGIPVDMVGGTSIGAIVGAAIAMGLDSKELTQLCRETFQKKNPFNDYAIPIVSLLRSRKIDKAARQAYGEAAIEDLWLSFFCISSNLGSCGLRVHTRGPVWSAARTSSSLPGVMVPVIHDGFVHVDGGVMNNLPGDIMRRRAGMVIVVDVDSRENMSPGFDAFPSTSKIFWSRVLPWKKRIRTPNVAEIMMATIMTGCRQSADAVKADADLSLEPPVRGIGILDFKKIEETAQAAYDYTQGMIDQLPVDSPLRRFLGWKPAGGDGCPAD
jgi:predicted acylesterase/phospholipase RssA/CRP-like cAMP-binding protein